MLASVTRREHDRGTGLAWSATDGTPDLALKTAETLYGVDRDLSVAIGGQGALLPCLAAVERLVEPRWLSCIAVAQWCRDRQAMEGCRAVELQNVVLSVPCGGVP